MHSLSFRKNKRTGDKTNNPEIIGLNTNTLLINNDVYTFISIYIHF